MELYTENGRISTGPSEKEKLFRHSRMCVVQAIIIKIFFMYSLILFF